MNFTWYQGHYFRLMVWCIKTDKSAVAEEVWKLCSLENESNDDPVTDATRVIVFNGMAMVNHISIKKSKLNMCHDFAESFSKIILLHARRCEEIKSYIWSLWRKFVKTANKMFPNYWNCSCTIYNHRYNTNHSLGYPRILGFNRNQKWIDRIPQSKVISCSYSPINQVCNFLQK